MPALRSVGGVVTPPGVIPPSTFAHLTDLIAIAANPAQAIERMNALAAAQENFVVARDDANEAERIARVAVQDAGRRCTEVDAHVAAMETKLEEGEKRFKGIEDSIKEKIAALDTLREKHRDETAAARYALEQDQAALRAATAALEAEKTSMAARSVDIETRELNVAGREEDAKTLIADYNARVAKLRELAR